MANPLKAIANFFNRKPAMMTDKEAESILKSNSGYAGLWAQVKEQTLFGKKVTRPFAQIPTIFKAIKAIADNVPQAELVLKDWETEKEIYPKDFTELFARPNPLMSYNVFMQYVVGFLMLYGETFIVKVPSIGQMIGTRKIPAELWTFNPKKLSPVIINNRMTGWRHSGSQEIFAVENVIHIKDFNPYCDMRGFDPTGPIENIMDIDYLSLIYNKVFFENNATMGFMLSTDGSLSDVQRARLKEWLEKKHSGASNAYKTAILEAGLKPVQTGSTHTDMDFIEQKRYTREEMLGVWRVPKALFNITEDLNYATFVGQMKIFWQYSIMPALMKISDGLNSGLVELANPSIFCEFDCSNVPAFQEDLANKVAVAKDLWAMGFTGNEINEKLQLGFDPKPWRDKWWIPISTVPSDVAEESALAPADNPPPADNPTPAPDPAKSLKAEDARAKLSWAIFVKSQGVNEIRFRGALKTHFFQQRIRLLKTVDQAGTIDGWTVNALNWSAENDLLGKKAKKFVYAGVLDGEKFARSVAGDITPAEEEIFKQRLAGLVADRNEKLKRINTTVKNEIAVRHAEILKAGGTLADLAEMVRSVYNKAESRTLIQSRTETSAAMNGATQLYYEQIKVTHKKWVTAGDEAVRETHRKIDGEVVRIDQKFSNGVDFPAGDGAPEEVINCRCTAYPIFRKD